MQTRRSFLRQVATGSFLAACGQFPWRACAGGTLQPLSILHTNDTHSRLEPFAEDIAGIAKGSGGVAARAALINSIRREQSAVMLLDAGDFLQGTPYYDIYQGVPELKAMELMGYDALTLGEHDLYAGIAPLADLLAGSSLNIVCSNYRFPGTALENRVRPYMVLRKGGMKIGIMGIGGPLQGLVPATVSAAIIIEDPITAALETAARLHKKEHCDMVICLSRLGLPDYSSGRSDDRILARESEGIDLIIGGRTHTFLEQPLWIKNKKGNDIMVTQSGWGGVQMGRLNYIFSDNKKILSANAQTVILGK